LMLNFTDQLARAKLAMASPPALARLKRAEPKGERVAFFLLPLELCKPQNRTSHGQAWRYARDKDRIREHMWLQHRPRKEPLPGRPMVRCTRFSSTEPDVFSDWAKMAIDVLCVPTTRSPRRLGIIRDDRPKEAEIVQSWEPAKRGQGFVVIEVFRGSEADSEAVCKSAPAVVDATPRRDLSTAAKRRAGLR
jgi:hypothetical protein